MELENNTAIHVDNISVNYDIFLKNKKFSLGRREKFSAISGISFTIKSGEVVALLGKNGSGKTTLLKSIGGYLRPDDGKIITKGRVYTLSGANPGLIPYISGRENVRQLSAVYGISKEEKEEFEKEVEDFCELGEAYDRQYKTLSTGMAGRIGFGFTTSLNPEVLLMDETLGVGDEEFRRKAEAKAESFMAKGETILLSTHSLGLAKKMCKRGLVLDSGKLIFDGEIESAIKKYLNLIKNNSDNN